MTEFPLQPGLKKQVYLPERGGAGNKVLGWVGAVYKVLGWVWRQFICYIGFGRE